MLIQSSHDAAARGLDAYFTPPEAIASLIAIERARMPKAIWEPACGDGAIVLPLREAGFNVFASDIHDYGLPGTRVSDFLKTPFFGSYPQTPIGIITNPPFRLALAFARKAVGEAEYVALLLRTNFLESVGRLAFFREHPPSRIWVSSRRLPMMHRQGWEGPRAASNTAHAWFIWDGPADRCEVRWFDWKEHPAQPGEPD